jgi:hypothetical protein
VEILQFRLREGNILYLVESAEGIRWATAKEIVMKYPLDLVAFYEKKIRKQSEKERMQSYQASLLKLE